MPDGIRRMSPRKAAGITQMERVPGSHLDEADLFRGTPRSRTRQCACGGSITALMQSDADVQDAVAAHQATSTHRLWRSWMEAS